jgi:hypothetical protein
LPGKIVHSIPEAMKLGGVDQSVVLLAVGDDPETITRWMRELLVYRLAGSGKVVISADGRPVAVLRVHPDRLPEIAGRRTNSVHDLITLPKDLLTSL